MSHICHVYDTEFMQEGDFSGLHLWCLDRDSIPIHIIVKNTPIYLYIELPETPVIPEWNDASVELLFESFKQKFRNCAPFMMEFTERQKLYYYNEDNTTPMARLFFRNPKDMNICASKLSKSTEYDNFGPLIFRVYEKDISVRRKIFTIRRARYCQWFSFQGKEIPFSHPERQAIEGKEGRRIREFVMYDYNSITPISADESKSWLSRPRVLSFDIETYTDNHHALPDKYNPKHVIYMVSCLFQQTGVKESREQYVIVSEPCAPIEGVNVICVKDEEELLIAFQDLIEHLDPEIMTGYNIFGYDNPYIDARFNMFREMYEPCSRLQGHIPTMTNMEWASGAYGKTIISYLKMPGRITIDMYPLIKRDYKFDKYTLDFVSKTLLGDQKVPIDHKDIFKAYESKDIDQITHITKYCVQDSALVLDLYEKMNVWIGLVEMANIVGVEIMDLFTRGQQIRCLSQIYDMTSRNKFVINSREQITIEYEGGKVQDPIIGVNDFVFSIDFNSLYPSIMMAYNICFTTLIPEIYVQDFDPKDYNAIEVKPGVVFCFVKDHVRKGILPQLVRSLVDERNAVRAEMKVLEKRLKSGDGTQPVLSPEEKKQIELTLIVLDKRQLGLKVSANSMYGFLGVQNGGKLPLIEGAISITAKGRQLITEVNDYVVEKHNAIIVYGDTDSSMIKIPGVESWEECYAIAKQINDEISGTPAVLDEDGNVVEPAKAGIFPPPLKMEVENYMRFIGIAKKKYAAFTFNKGPTPDTVTIDGEVMEKIYKRGIVLARRDNFPYLRKKYTEVLYSVLRKNPITETFKIIVDAVIEVMSGSIPARGNFTIIRGLGKEYSSDTYFMKIFSDELARMGHPVAAGDRLEYVIIKDDPTIPLGRRMRLIEMYEDSMSYDEAVDGPRPDDVYPVEEIDYMYYITNGLQNPIDQLFTAGYYDLFTKTSLGDSAYSPKNSNAKPVRVCTPIKMMMALIKDNMKKCEFTLEDCIKYLKDEIYDWFVGEYEKRTEMEMASDAIPLEDFDDLGEIQDDLIEL